MAVICQPCFFTKKRMQSNSLGIASAPRTQSEPGVSAVDTGTQARGGGVGDKVMP